MSERRKYLVDTVLSVQKQGLAASAAALADFIKGPKIVGQAEYLEAFKTLYENSARPSKETFKKHLIATFTCVGEHLSDAVEEYDQKTG